MEEAEELAHWLDIERSELIQFIEQVKCDPSLLSSYDG